GSRPDLTATTERLSAAVAAERLARTDIFVVDVRTPTERALRSIPNSVGIPLTQLPNRMTELPEARPLLVYCAGGYRSSIADSLLHLNGFTRVSELAGGIAAWE